MKTYRYEAIDQQGKTIIGQSNGESVHAVSHLLKSQRLIPIDIQERKQASQFKFERRLALKPLVLMTMQLSTLLNAGLPVDEALRVLIQQTANKRVKQLLEKVHIGIMEGKSLAEALKVIEKRLPSVYIPSIESAERSGHLAAVLSQLAHYLESKYDTQQSLQQALIYPLLMLCFSIAVVLFMLVWIVPQMVEVFQGSGQQLPMATQWLIATSDVLRSYGYVLLILALLLLIISRVVFTKSAVIRANIHRLLLTVPWMGQWLRLVQTSRYIRSLSMMIRSGVSILEAMRISRRIITFIPIKVRLEQSEKSVQEGQAIYKSLERTQDFSPMVVHMMANGEEVGKLPDMLDKACDMQDMMLSRAMKMSLSLFEPALIFGMGLVVLFIVMAVLLPLFDMTTFVTI